MDVAKLKKVGSRVLNGGWVKDIPLDGCDDLALKVRGRDNVDARRLRTRLVEELSLPAGTDIPREDLDRIGIEVIAGAILVDWNLTAEGAALPCTPETVRELLADPDCGRMLAEAALYASAVVAQIGAESFEDAAKNSETP